MVKSLFLRSERFGIPLFLLPAVLGFISWFGPRFIWGRSWRSTTQFGAVAPTTCADAEVTSRARVTAFSDPHIDIYTSIWWAFAGDRTHKRFTALPPVWASARTVNLGEIGVDGFKTLASLDYLSDPCVSYSFGGNAETGFEEALLAATPCHVYQFDCTVSAQRMAAAIALIPVALQSLIVLSRT